MPVNCFSSELSTGIKAGHLPGELRGGSADIEAAQGVADQDIRAGKMLRQERGVQILDEVTSGSSLGRSATSPPMGGASWFRSCSLFPQLAFLAEAAVRSGAPGGLFTPSLTAGAMLGGVLGQAWSWLVPGGSPGLYCLLGTGAVLAATTQGPISTVVLLMDRGGGNRHSGGADHRAAVDLRRPLDR